MVDFTVSIFSILNSMHLSTTYGWSALLYDVLYGGNIPVENDFQIFCIFSAVVRLLYACTHVVIVLYVLCPWRLVTFVMVIFFFFSVPSKRVLNLPRTSTYHLPSRYIILYVW